MSVVYSCYVLIGIVKWITEASQDGKLKAEDAVFAAMQFFALLEAFTTWPYLFGKEEKYDQQTILQSAVDMFLDHYEIRS
jgi:TetR/AcrR family transcriptional regulator of autoinduction and epiphytic fitness